MNFWRLIRRSLAFYRRTNIAVALTVAIGAAVLTGALAIGDSVRYSLKLSAEARLGRTTLALVQKNRFFRTALADEVSKTLVTDVAPVLAARGLVSDGEGSKRVSRVEVLGVDERFFKIGPGNGGYRSDQGEGAILSESLARRLGVSVGDEVVIRVDKQSFMPRDIPLAPDSQRTVALRLAVKAVAGDVEFGRFSLQTNQMAAMNVFLPLGWLQDKLDYPGQANMLLVASELGRGVTVHEADNAVRKSWRLEDAGLELRMLEDQRALELRSRRIFIDDVLAEAALEAGQGASGVLTYFVNEIRVSDKVTPYSMAAAIEPGGIIPRDMRDDEIVINQWLADDLGAKIGDLLELKYFVLGPMRKLYEKQRVFRVREILPMEGLAVDPQLMPGFPGLADSENCSDWEPGIPIDLDKIRPKDEEYWDKFHGTPKAFVTLQAGQQMWANRYGSLTAVRYAWSEGVEEEVSRKILDRVGPASVGLFFRPVGHSAAAGGQTTDFGQLFAGLSMFLIAAAVILTGLVFVFGIESRSEQIGTLLALGFSPRLVKRLILSEGAVIAAAGSIAGTLGGLLYTRVMVYCLMTIWSGAVGGAEIRFHCEPVTLLAGGLGGFIAAAVAMLLTLWGQVRRPVSQLLSGAASERLSSIGKHRSGWGSFVIAAAAIAGAAAILAVGGRGGSSETVSGAFFAAGTLLLIAAIAANYGLLRAIVNNWTRPMISLGGLAFRNVGRRAGRSVAVVGLLACGVFLVVAVGANRHDPLAGAERRDSGTGGFVLFAESAVSILYDLNNNAVRKSVGLDGLTKEVEVVQLCVYDGGDASCLNMNRVERPRLLGVRPEDFSRRGAFRFTAWLDEKGRAEGWDLLSRDLGDNIVPAIGDYPTVFWALGKKVGDEIDYMDERGRAFKLRIVGMVESSILQGGLVISEENFTSRFPSEDEYRVFLVDAPAALVAGVEDKLSRALRDFGIEVSSTKERLAGFSVVENTYLSIFTMLGGLGLVLGSIGLGLVVLRNALERRGEFAMLRAMGFGRGLVKRILFFEHAGLLVLGLVCGFVTAMVAVLPVVRWPGGQVPYVSIAVTVAAIGVNGGVWVWLAAGAAVRGEMLDALRNE